MTVAPEGTSTRLAALVAARPRAATAWSHPLVRLAPLLAFLLLAALLVPDRQDDEAGYVELARGLVHGNYAVDRPDALLDADPSYPSLWFGPGLPAVLALPLAAGLPLEVVRLLGPLFLFGALVLFHALVRRSTSPATALVATYALGLYLPFLTLLTNLHSEPLAVLLVVAAAAAAVRLVEDGGRLWLLLAGASLAGLALTRVDYGWVVTFALVAAAVWWLATRVRAAARLTAACALALVLCVPWLAYTAAETGRPLQWGNSGSLSLYWMSSPYPGDLGDWQQANAVFADPRLAPHRPLFESLRGLPLAEQNSRLERRALSNIVHHPGAYAENVAANVSRLLFDTPYTGQLQRLGSLVFALPNALLLGIVACAAAAAARVRRRLPAAFVPVAAFAGLSFALHALVAGYPRMLVPIVPLLAWLAAVALWTASRPEGTKGHGTARPCR